MEHQEVKMQVTKVLVQVMRMHPRLNTHTQTHTHISTQTYKHRDTQTQKHTNIHSYIHTKREQKTEDNHADN